MFFNHVGIKQEEETCPYAWLPFTGKHHNYLHLCLKISTPQQGCKIRISFLFSPLPNLSAAMLPKIQYTKINITFLETFGPVFASEGGSASLTATMTLNPNLANLQPEAQWYRDGKCYKESFHDKVITP